MQLEIWLTYLAAFTLLSILPGPSVFMVIGQTLSKGLGAGLSCVLGDLLGGVVMITCAFAGLSTVLAVSSEIYVVIKWLGVAYLAWLGLAQIHAASQVTDLDPAKPHDRPFHTDSLRAGFLTGVLNPKAILFYAAFLAQFITPDAAMLPQFLVLLATSSLVVCVVLASYSLLAAQAKQAFRSAHARKNITYASGACFLGGSALLASR